MTLAVLPRGVVTGLATNCSPVRAHAAGFFDATVTTSQGIGSYRLYVPPSYDGTTTVPLVLNLHGLGWNSLEQEQYTSLSTTSAAPGGGFVIIYPDGNIILNTPGGARHWNNTQLGPPERDDVAFLSGLLDSVESSMCIDESRVYATGMSNGAQMSSRLACSLSSRIAAIAPVAGAYYPPLSDTPPGESCSASRPVPIIAFHGTADTIVPFSGGPSPYLAINFRLPIDNDTPDPDVMQSWAAHNGCPSGRQTSQVTAHVVLVQYTGCRDNAAVDLYRVEGGDHTWPGAGINLPGTTYEISANGLMWAFFERHPQGPQPATATPTITSTPTVTNTPTITPTPTTSCATPPTPTSTATGGPTATPLSTPLPCTDADRDGCTFRQESGTDAIHGGLRSDNNFWDFYDVWTRPDPVSQPNYWVRDKVVTLQDILGVRRRFGATDHGGADPINRTSDPLIPPTSDIGYHPDYDRGARIGPNPWNLAPPDGAIDIPNDILGVAKQFGHSCL